MARITPPRNPNELSWELRLYKYYGDQVELEHKISLEQHLSRDIGVSARAMVSDGKSEVYAYTPTDRSLAINLLAKGASWQRGRDLAGVGYAVNWISDIHAKYLNMGGVDGFIGDGHINKAAESVVEVFYSLNVFDPLWVSADYQHLINPAFNGDRGPVEIVGGRVHAESAIPPGRAQSASTRRPSRLCSRHTTRTLTEWYSG